MVYVQESVLEDEELRQLRDCFNTAIQVYCMMHKDNIIPINDNYWAIKQLFFLQRFRFTV